MRSRWSRRSLKVSHTQTSVPQGTLNKAASVVFVKKEREFGFSTGRQVDKGCSKLTEVQKVLAHIIKTESAQTTQNNAVSIFLCPFI